MALIIIENNPNAGATISILLIWALAIYGIHKLITNHKKNKQEKISILKEQNQLLREQNELLRTKD